MKNKLEFFLLVLFFSFIENIYSSSYPFFDSTYWLFDNNRINVSIYLTNLTPESYQYNVILHPNDNNLFTRYYADTCGNFTILNENKPVHNASCPDNIAYSDTISNNPSNQNNNLFDWIISFTLVHYNQSCGFFVESSSVTIRDTDTSRLDKDCIDLTNYFLQYDDVKQDALGINYYYKKGVFEFDLIDNCGDLDEVLNNDNLVTITNIGSNRYKIKIDCRQYSTTEFGFLIGLKDNDRCKERTILNVSFFCDNEIPSNSFLKAFYPLGIVNDPLNTSHNNFFLNIIPPEYLYVINSNNNEYALKGTSFCKFSTSDCYIFYVFDRGVGIRNFNIINLKNNLNYALNDAIVQFNILGNVKDFFVKNFSIRKSNQDIKIRIDYDDILDNSNSMILYLPFGGPETLCNIKKEVNGYTKLSFVQCNLSFFYDGANYLFDYGQIYYCLDLNNNINEFVFDLNNFPARLSLKSPSNCNFINSGNFLIDPSLNDVYDNVELKYLGVDSTLNIENLDSIDVNLKEARASPNILRLNLDYKAPDLLVYSEQLLDPSNNQIINRESIYNLINKGPLSIEEVPINITFICNDEGSASCSFEIYYNRLLWNGTLNNGENITVTISSINANSIKIINLKDALDNSISLLTVNLNTSLGDFNISYNFSKPYLGNSPYIFLEDVNLTVNASIDGDISKIRKIEIIVENRNYTFLGNYGEVLLNCNLGDVCNYNIEIRVFDIYNREKSINFQVEINKDPYIMAINYLSSFSIKNNRVYFPQWKNDISFLCLVNKRIPGSQNVKIEKFLVLDCDLSNNCIIVYENNSVNKDIYSLVYDIDFNNRDGYINFTCELNISNTRQSKTIIFNYTIDDKEPYIDHLIINGVDYKNRNPIIVEGPSLSFNISVKDRGIGVSNSEFVFLSFNRLYNFINNLSFNYTINIEGKYEFKIVSEDDFGKRLSKNYDLIVDINDPTVSYSVLNKVGQKVKVKFFCIDFPSCNITSISCNGNNVFNGNAQDVTVECNINNNGITEWNLVLQDYRGNNHNYGPIFIQGIIREYEIKLLPDIFNNNLLFCYKGNSFPILFRFINYIDENIKINLPDYLTFLSGKNTIELKPHSKFELVAFFSCPSTLKNISLHFNVTTPTNTFLTSLNFSLVPFSND